MSSSSLEKVSTAYDCFSFPCFMSFSSADLTNDRPTFWTKIGSSKKTSENSLKWRKRNQNSVFSLGKLIHMYAWERTNIHLSVFESCRSLRVKPGCSSSAEPAAGASVAGWVCQWRQWLGAAHRAHCEPGLNRDRLQKLGRGMDEPPEGIHSSVQGYTEMGHKEGNMEKLDISRT